MTTVAPTALAFIPGISGWEWIIILVIALLIFGKRLPDLGRSVGKTIVEFKKGLKDVEKDIETESARPSQPNHGTHAYSQPHGQGQLGHSPSAPPVGMPSEQRDQAGR